MFDKFEQIGERIYVYKNFLSKDELKVYEDIIANIPDSDWIDATIYEKPTLFSYYSQGMILKKIQDELMEDPYYLEDTPFLTKMKFGMGMEEHSDDCPHCKQIKDPNMHVDGIIVNDEALKRCVKYGLVLYLTEFEGGEIYYTEQNIVYKPNPGDLVMHGTDEYCKHGVKPVTGGVRITMAPYVVEYLYKEDAEKAKLFWENYDKKF
jgi:hypothetical protein